AIFYKKRGGAPGSDQRQPLSRIGNPHLLECGKRRSEQPEAVARWQLQPARDRDKAARLQVAEIFFEGFDRVDVALAENQRAGRRGSEVIEQRKLDEVVALPGSGYEAAPLGNADMHAWLLVEVSREIGKGISHEPHRLRIELGHVDPRRVMIERQQDVGAAPGTNDERLRLLQQMIRQRRGGVVEIGEPFELAVKGGDRA